MSNIQELREKRAQLHADAQTEYDKITPDMTEGEAKELEARFDTAMAEFDKLGGQVDKLERLERAGLDLKAGDPRRPEGRGEEKAPEQRADTDRAAEYREVFSKYLANGMADMDAEERGVMQTAYETRAQSTGTGSEGGFTVPTELASEIDKAMAAWGPMLTGTPCRTITTTGGNPLQFPTIDDTTQTGELTAENAAATDDGTGDVVFGQKQLDAYLYDTKIVRVPIQLLQDSAFNVDQLLGELFGERLGRGGNTALTTGSGSAQPNGIVTASGAGITAASATAITGDELFNLVHSVDPAYRDSPSAGWMFNDATFGAIRKLKDGQGNYLFQMGDISKGAPSTLLDKPFYVNQAVPAMTTGLKSIIFGDMSRYIVRKVNGFQMMRLNERYAENFQVGMMAYHRIDGELLNSAAVKAITMA